MSESTTETRTAPSEWIPEFEGQRPPFQPGNTAALVSGYRSPRKIAEVVTEVRAEMVDADPLLANPRHGYALDAAAWAVSEVRLLRQHVATVGMFDGNGRPRQALLDRLRTSEAKSARALAAIGFDPTSEARLRRDQAATVAFGGAELLASRMAEGRAALDAHAATAALDSANTDSTTQEDNK
jgi:hypothetical protein